MPQSLYRLKPEMVDLLLSLRANPNAINARSGKTLWRLFLDQLDELDERGLSLLPESERDGYLLRASRVFQSLVRNGAEIGDDLKGEGDPCSPRNLDSLIDKVFSLRLPDEAALLKEFVKESRLGASTSPRKRPLDMSLHNHSSKKQPFAISEILEVGEDDNERRILSGMTRMRVGQSYSPFGGASGRWAN
jgi:hypothetical protein